MTTVLRGIGGLMMVYAALYLAQYLFSALYDKPAARVGRDERRVRGGHTHRPVGELPRGALAVIRRVHHPGPARALTRCSTPMPPWPSGSSTTG